MTFRRPARRMDEWESCPYNLDQGQINGGRGNAGKQREEGGPRGID